MRFVFLSALVLLSAAPLRAADAPQDQETVHITLDQAVEAGIRGATVILKDRNQVSLTGTDLLKSYANFLPNLGVSALYGYQSGTSLQPINGSSLVNSTYTGGDYLVTSSLNLFNGFGDAAALKAALDRKDESQLTLERAKQQIALDVTQSFLQAVLDDQLSSIAFKNLGVSRDRLKLFLAQRDVGAVSTTDVYRQQAETATDESTFIVYRNRAKVSLLRFLQRIRLDARKNYFLDAPVLNPTASTKPIPNEKDLISEALEARRDLKAKQQEFHATQADVTYARRTYFPTLDLMGSFGGAGRYYQQNIVAGNSNLPASQPGLFDQIGSQTVSTISLNLNWEIFDRLSTTQAVKHAEIQSDNTNIDLDDLSNQVVIEVRQAYADYGASVDQLAASDTGLQAAQKAFEYISGRFKLGASNFIDLAVAQAVLAQSQATRAQALVNLKLREQALNYFTGHDPTEFKR